MDSITQIVLGAACGEAVLGRKIGNRAMVWGAIGGTIPDLDVLATFFTDPMTALAFHRNFMHSFTFAILFPLVMAAFTQWLYTSGTYHRRGYRLFIFVLNVLFLGVVGAGVAMVPYVFTGAVYNPLVAICIVAVLSLWLLLFKGYWATPLQQVQTTYGDWYKLFFWSIFTHPILDMFTSYGTQFFQPFSDYRVAFNVVSVVDPIYTVPFAFCVLLAACLYPLSYWRTVWVWAGIVWSSSYLVFCTYHKQLVNAMVEKSLQANGITYQRYMTAPSIFNNILWFTVAEGDTAYYAANYSLNDKAAVIPFFNTIPKNHALLGSHARDRDVRIMQWFSNGYYHVAKDDTQQLHIHDLRFGLLQDTIEVPKGLFFRISYRLEDGELKGRENQERDIPKDALQRLKTRIAGR